MTNPFPVCRRCGLKCAPSNRVLLEAPDGCVIEHPYCSEHYEGTEVHWQNCPDPAAPGEVHTHLRNDGLVDLYDIRTLRKLHPMPTDLIPLDRETVDGLCVSYSTDPADAEAVCAIRQTMGTLYEPLLFVRMPMDGEDNAVWLIDGVHRAIGLFNRGMQFLPGVILEERDVAPYRIRGTERQLADLLAVSGVVKVG